jgi:protoporphyrinogen oxidase
VTRVVILGGGPAGVGGAWRLRTQGRADVVLFERSEHFGGNSGSFEWRGHRLDFGSHRLHPACEPAILADVRGFLGDGLLDRPRHGRIFLLGRWVRFPLKPLDLLVHLDRRFALGSALDLAKKLVPRRAPAEETFATVLERSLGRTICTHFYFPYARKLWGLDPHELSAIQARRRVSAAGFAKLFRKVLDAVPGFQGEGAGRFFYPRDGYGAISEAYADAARAAGAELCAGWTVTAIERPESPVAPWRVHAEKDGTTRTEEADLLWSTVPITLLAKMLRPAPPEAVVAAAERIDYRSMLLVYLDLPVERFSEYDAHYFPGVEVATTRLSEPKNYAARAEPAGSTVLCAEIPCSRDDPPWRMSDSELGALVADDLRTAGLDLPAAPRAVTTRRLPQAYPIYTQGYETAFDALDRWMTDTPRLLTYGRQGLFAHDNTHHALAMAYGAAECVTDAGAFDEALWSGHREVFRTHVVVD